MVANPVPFLANFFLYHSEKRWIGKIRKTDLRHARWFADVFCFIDDLAVVNESGEFERSYKDIYPPELELKKGKNTTQDESFLDLYLNIRGRQFSTRLFDKRDDHPFSIARISYLLSNILLKIFYSSFGAELLGIVRTTTISSAFKASLNLLINRIVKQSDKSK